MRLLKKLYIRCFINIKFFHIKIKILKRIKLILYISYLVGYYFLFKVLVLNFHFLINYIFTIFIRIFFTLLSWKCIYNLTIFKYSFFFFHACFFHFNHNFTFLISLILSYFFLLLNIFPNYLIGYHIFLIYIYITNY